MIDFLFTPESIARNGFQKNIEVVLAAVKSDCFYTISLPPRYLEEGAIAIGDTPLVNICSMSQYASLTYPEVAILEVAMAIENGADEIEIPIDMIAIKNGDIDLALGEIDVLVKEIDGAAQPTVFMESGEFNSFEQFISMVKRLELLGVYQITMNSDPKDFYNIKYLDETIAFIEENEMEITLKINANININNLESEVDKLFERYGDSSLTVRMTL
ncbi:MAG: hypothetical protein R3Y50_00260 [Rikenellaceae bacterium]